MTPERWQQVKELFRSALERDVEERAAFLDRACAGDDGLRSEVESLLASSEESDSIVETPVAAAAAELFRGGQAESLVGQRLGHYEIMELVGEGGMGTVYLAKDTRLGRKVAVKMILSYFSSDADRLRRFKQEASAASALNHPNILTIYEIGETSGTHFIATEFIEGVTLRERMTGARLKIGEVLNVAEPIASALDAAHKSGIVHRDIKPENIMVRRDSIVKVLDFGLAKLTMPQAAMVDTEAATIPRIDTGPGVVMGTVQYMSPEQARGQKVDARTDIWSLGCVLYEMVSGRVPFEGGTGSDVTVAILGRDPLPLARYAPDVPAEVEWIVRKALRKDREERYQTAKELLTDLRTVKQRLVFETELERSGTPEKASEARRLASSGHLESGTTEVAAAQTGAGRTQTTSSAEYIVGEIRRHRLAALLILATLVAAIITVGYFVIPRFLGRSDKAGGPFPSDAGTIRSIAVLPFTNAGGNPDTEYLSDGISESLINSLSQLPGTKVIARSSSFKYKGKDVDPQEVANTLGVEGVLTGRVEQRGDNLLISVELVDARDKTHVWGEKYNRRVSDVLEVQAEISREISGKLRLRLTPGEQQRLAKRETANPEAYELLLKGRFYTRKGDALEHLNKSIEYYNQAIVVDPNYALAYAGLSTSYTLLAASSAGDPKELIPKAELAAGKALELDESLAEGHVSLAEIKLNGWDWAGAEREYKRAIELNPNLALAHIRYSRYLSYMGRHEQAIAESKRARELDPLSPGVNAGVGLVLNFARQYDQAIEALKKALELNQNYRTAHEYLGYTYTEKGMYAEAIAAYQQAIKVGGDNTSTQIFLGAAYARAGARGRAQAILKRLETSKGYVSHGELAALYASLGERERAFASLERAYAAHDLQLKYLGVDPAFDPLRTDPRFTDLKRRVGLSP